MKFLLSLALTMLTLATPAREYFVFFGTYTGQKSKGIYVSKFDSRTGTLSPAELAVETKSPSFLALHPNGRVLYAVGESSSVGPNKQGAVTAFSIDPASGKLTTLGTQPSGGGGPCHLTLDTKRGVLYTANYGSGSMGALKVGADGALEGLVTSAQHSGSSVDKQRQEGPHAHCAVLDPDKKYLLACDLGLDKIMVYLANEPLTPNDPPFAATAPGLGPRHLAFRPDGKFVYVVNEMGSSITSFRYNDRHGTLREDQTVSTLPDGFTGNSSCAEIEVHPSGKFVYASNRGHDSIAVFSLDKRTGQMKLVEIESTQGKTPRHFALDPAGEWLLAENQGSDTVAVFRINRKTGALEATGTTLSVPTPVCAVFLPAR